MEKLNRGVTDFTVFAVDGADFALNSFCKLVVFSDTFSRWDGDEDEVYDGSLVWIVVEKVANGCEFLGDSFGVV